MPDSRRRRRSLSALALLAALAVGVGLVVSLGGSTAQPDEGPLIACDVVTEITGEYWDGVDSSATAIEAAMSADQLERMAVSKESLAVVADDPSPEFGIVELGPDADGTVTDAELDGRLTSFLVFDEGEAVAQLYVERTPQGEYWVAGSSSC